MAWLEIHQTVWTNRKTLHLAGLLGIERELAAAKMIQLWHWCLDNAEDGELGALPPYVVAQAASWQGDPAAFIDAAVEAGYMDRVDVSLKLHDWWDYAGRLIERRRRDAERKREERGHPKDTAKPVQRTSSGHPADAPPTSRCNSTVQNSTEKTPSTPPSRSVVAKAAEAVAADPTILNERTRFSRAVGGVVGLTRQGREGLATGVNNLLYQTYEDISRRVLWSTVLDWEATCGHNSLDAGKRYSSLQAYLRNRADKMREATREEGRTRGLRVVKAPPEEIAKREALYAELEARAHAKQVTETA